MPSVAGTILIKRSCNLFDSIRFKDIILLDIIEARQTDTALHAARHFLHVFLDPLERIQRVVSDSSTIAVDPDTTTTLA